MFIIIGADGKEYGPVPADRVRDWLSAGRANTQTRIKRVGDATWTVVGSLPEFSAPGAAVPAAAAAAPGGAGPAAGGADYVSPADLIARARPLDIFGCLGRGWQSGKANFFPILGVSLLVGLCAGLAGAIPIVGFFANLLLTGPFYGGLYYYVLKKVRSEPTEVGDAFSGFSNNFPQLMLGSLVVILLTIIGFVCLIIPGIYLAVAWIFSYISIRERNLQFWEGMELSRRVISAQWFRVFGLLLMMGLIACALAAAPVGLMIAGAAAAQDNEGPGVALIAAGGFSLLIVVLLWVPFFSTTLLHAYEDLFHPEAAQ